MYIHFTNLVRGFSPKTPPAHSNCTYICLYVLQSFASPDASDCSLPVMLDIHRAAHLFAPRCPLFYRPSFICRQFFYKKKQRMRFYFFTPLCFLSLVFLHHIYFFLFIFSQSSKESILFFLRHLSISTETVCSNAVRVCFTFLQAYPSIHRSHSDIPHPLLLCDNLPDTGTVPRSFHSGLPVRSAAVHLLPSDFL